MKLTLKNCICFLELFEKEACIVFSKAFEFVFSTEKFSSKGKYSIQLSGFFPISEIAHDAQSSSLQTCCVV